jgi:GTPase
LEHLVTQLNYRLGEGSGEAVYELGVADDGTPTGLSDAYLEASIATLRGMADELGAETQVVRISEGTQGGCVAQVLVRVSPIEASPIGIRVAVIGDVDSGKSSLVGVLTKGGLDNGRGLARSKVFRHQVSIFVYILGCSSFTHLSSHGQHSHLQQHEMDSGRTSAISAQLLGFDTQGED